MIREEGVGKEGRRERGEGVCGWAGGRERGRGRRGSDVVRKYIPKSMRFCVCASVHVCV